MKFRKPSIIIFVVMLLCIGATAQTSGKVVDQAGRPLAGVTVQLMNTKDSTIAITTQTDSAGTYKLKAAVNRLNVLRFSYTGLQTKYLDIMYPYSTKPVTDTIRMLPDENVLNEVVIRSFKPVFQQQPFGISVDIAQSILSKGSSVLEVLERSPGVAMDHRNRSISLNGKPGVIVMLNGQLLRMPLEQVITILSSLPASEVARIDLMHTAPAGMDADGMGGIIRIVFKQNRSNGSTASMSVTAGAGWGPKAGATLQLAHNKNKWKFTGSYTYALDRMYSDLRIESHQSMPAFGGPLSVLVWDTSKATQQNHTGIINISYHPDSVSGIGVQAIIGQSLNRLRVADRSVYFLQHDSTLYFQSRVASTNDWNNLSAGVFYDKQFSQKQTLSARADYLRYVNDNPTGIDNRLTDKDGKAVGNNDPAFARQQRGYALTTIDVAAVKADYTGEVAPNIQWQTGIKLTQAVSRGLSGLESFVGSQWVSRNGAATRVHMHERIAAAYLNADLTLKERWKISFGGRYEYAATDITDPETGTRQVNRVMGKFFPAIFVNHKINRRDELQLSYAERISRPSYNDLASFVRYSDATAVYTGNPLLLPGISRQLKIGYATGIQSLQLSYSHDVNTIAGYQLTESQDRRLLFVGPQNVKFSETIQLQWNLNTIITSWWSFCNSAWAGLNRFAVDYTKRPVEYTYFKYGISLTYTFRLPKSYSAELSGWVNSPSFNGTVRSGAAVSVSAGIRKELANNNGRLQLSVSDIFMTQLYRNRYGTLTQEAFDIHNLVLYSAESRMFPIFRLAYSKSFGSTEKAIRKVKEAAEESGRVRIQ